MDIRDKIHEMRDFPKPGIVFRDITPLLSDPAYFSHAVNQIVGKLDSVEFDMIISPESRGFIFGVPVALRMSKPFIPARKPGKLPREVLRAEYGLEYGNDILEIHADDIPRGGKVVIVDDLLATGGTVRAMCDMIESAGAEVVGLVFLIELANLYGRKRLGGYGVKSLITY
ncbi:MAG: adenine phosphoribosyltransferase [Defluviitaleaceae bacterium]|nr:adenine phosphoribosyltransferase [Defluviitaleaceae bacterium]